MPTTNLERARERLHGAIGTMREFLDSAERDLSHCSDTPKGLEHACQRVLHHMAWGFANASSGIESAMAALSRERELIATQEREEKETQE